MQNTLQPYAHDGERNCTRSWSGSHPVLNSLRCQAGLHQCFPIEHSDHWTQGLLLYHYSQAIWQKVQALGLQELYISEDEILKCFVQKTATTCFVPPSFVPPSFVWVAWQGVQQEAAPELDDINDFVYYFDRTWINDQFRLQQWNYYNYDGPTTITLKASTPGWSESWANPHPIISRSLHNI